MRIRIRSSDRNIELLFPTGLIFSKATAWCINHLGRKYAGDAMSHIPPEALDALFAEFRRMKRTHGSWDLVAFQSADCEEVLIRL